MKESQYNNSRSMLIGNRNWQSQEPKVQVGQLTLSDVKFEVGKENDLFTRVGIRLNKTLTEVMDMLKDCTKTF